MRRTDLAKHIPKGTKSVLDVGCSDAEMAPDVREKGVTNYVGIDMENSEHFINILRGRLDRYLVANLDKVKTFPFKPKEFDVIVFGDILEHLIDPWTVLKNFTDKYLKDDGLVIVSLPNSLFHYTAFRKILTGTHQYVGAGLWDKTHLRFFTKQNMLGLFDHAGLQPFKYDPNYEYDPWIYEKRNIIMALMNQILNFICFGSKDVPKIDIKHMEDLYTIQWRWVLKKKQITEAPKQ